MDKFISFLFVYVIMLALNKVLGKFFTWSYKTVKRLLEDEKKDRSR